MEVVERNVHLERESGRGQDLRCVSQLRLAYAILVALGWSKVEGRLNLGNVSASAAKASI